MELGSKKISGARVLLTGATGFIGAQVAKELVENGADVYALVRPNSDLSRLQDVASNLHLVTAELFSPSSLDTVPWVSIKPELCVHLAWYAVPRSYLSAPQNLTALTGSIELLTRLSKVGCGRFVGVGTCFEYNTSFGYLSEDSPTRADTLYSGAKLALYTVLQSMRSGTEMSFAWARLFYQYGPFEDKRRLVPSVITSLICGEHVALTSGEQVRDFLHVQDVARAICAILESSVEGPVNVGSGVPVTVRDLAIQIANLMEHQDLLGFGELPHPPSDPAFVCANNRRLLSLGWKPRFNLEDGLLDAIDWWRSSLFKTRDRSAG